MAVFPERIVLKTSSDSQQDIIDAIGSGGTDPIIKGEIVLGTTPGSVRLYASDEAGNIVQFGGSDATTVASLEDVDLAGIADGYVLKFNQTNSNWVSAENSFENLSDITLHTGNFTRSNDVGTNIDYYELDMVPSSQIPYEGLKISLAEIGTNAGETFFQADGLHHLSFHNGGAELKVADGVLRLGTSNDRDDFSASMKFRSNDNFHATISVPDDLGADTSFTLPPDNGFSGWALVSDGNGVTSWASSPAVDLSGTSISELSDVDVINATSGQGVSYDGSEWVPYDFKDTILKLDLVDDYNTAVPDSGHQGADFTDIGSIRINSGHVHGWASELTSAQWDSGRTGTEISIESQGDEDHGLLGIKNDVGPVVIAGEDSNSRSLTLLGYVANTSGSLRFSTQAVSSIAHSQSPNPVLPDNNVTITGPATTLQDYSLILPEYLGTTGQVLGTDSNGQLGWYDTYPPVGNGLIEFTATFANVTVSLSGISRVSGDALIAPLTIYPGLQYRIDNQTGSTLTIVDSNLNAYNDGITGNGNTGQIITWTVQSDVPQDLKLAVIQGGTVVAFLDIIAQSYNANITRESINELVDVDTVTSPPLDNFGLVYESGQWVPKPVFSQEGQIYLPSIIWNQDIPDGESPNSIGEFAYNYVLGGTNSISLYGTSATGAVWNSVLDNLISEEKALWLKLSFVDDQGRTSGTGLIPVTGFSEASGAYSISWDDVVVPFPFPDDFDFGDTLTQVTVKLIEKNVIDVPVLSVNGLPNEAEPSSNVILDVSKIDDVYIDNANELDLGFPYIKGSSSVNGQYELVPRIGDNGLVTDLLVSNLDARDINRRPMMLSGDTPQGRREESGTFVQLGATLVETTNSTVIFREISIEANSELDTTGVAYLKFQSYQTEGYLLGDNSLLSYDLADELWKPVGVDNGQVTSVNGQIGDVSLDLNSLDGVNIATATPGVALIFDGSQWAPGTASFASLGGLSDVNAPAPQDGQALLWDTANQEWAAGDVIATNALDDLTDVSYLNGSLTITDLDEISLTSAGTPSGVTRKVYTNSLYGAALASYETSTVDGSFIYAHETKGIELRSNPDVIRLSGEFNQTDNQPELRWESGNATADSPTGNFIGLKMPANVTTDQTYILPAADGATGQVLSTDGSGVLSWVIPGADLSTSSIDELQDVDTTASAPVTNQALMWNGSAWVPGDVAVDEASPAIVWNVGNNGNSGYLFTGSGFPAASADPVLYVVRGQKYTFNKTVAAHPFQLEDDLGNQYTGGVEETQPLALGELNWTVPMDAPSKLFYQCTAHPAMRGEVYVLNQGADLGSSNIEELGNVSSSAPIGGQALVWDGTQWTPGNVVAGGSTGSAISQATTETQASDVNGELTMIELGTSGTLVSVEADAEAWVTFYSSATSRTADASRASTDDPAQGSGVLAEFILPASTQVLTTPSTNYFNSEVLVSESIYAMVRDASTGAALDNVSVTVRAFAVSGYTAVSGGTFGSG